MEQDNSILGVNVSLTYPGQDYSGFSTNITIRNKSQMSVQLTDKRHPDFKPPYMTISFRQVEKKFLLKKTMVWVADVHLEHLNNIKSSQSDFVAHVYLIGSKYENSLVIKPEKGNTLHHCVSNWKFKLQFNEQVQFENVFKMLDVNLKTKIK